MVPGITPDRVLVGDPEYEQAVEEATGLRVLDFVTLIDYFDTGTDTEAYQGYYLPGRPGWEGAGPARAHARV